MAKKRFGDILLEARMVTPEELEQGLSAKAVDSDKRLGAILVGLGILTERQVTEALGLQFMLPVVDVQDYVTNVSTQNILPLDLMERLNAFPLEFQDRGSVLLVAISDPLDAGTQEELRKAASLDLRFALAPAEEIRGANLTLRSLLAPVPAPAVAVQPPVANVQAPVAAAQPPVANVQAPVEVVQPPVVNVQVPVAAAQPPVANVQAPVAAVQPPVANVQAPAAVVQPPVVNVQAPAAAVQPPVANVQVPVAAVQPPVAAVQAPAAAVQPPVAAVQAPAAAVQPPVANVQAPVAAVQPPVANVQAPTAAPEPAPEKAEHAIMPSFASLHAHQPKLGDILVQAGVIDESQLVRALQIQRGSEKRLGEVLVSENFISETRLAEALSTQLKLPLFTLTRYRPMPEAIRLVPRAVAERLSLIPLSIMEDDLLLVAMSNPLDLLGQDEVRMLTGRNLKVGIATASDINQNLDRLYNLQNNLEEAIEEVDTDLGQNLELDFDASSDEAPVIQLVSNLLQQAVREGASDIHVEVYEKMARVRFRVDGQLYSAFDYPVALHPSVSARLKIMSGMDIAEKRKPQDGRILIRVDGRRIDLRVSVLPTMNGEKVVLRILDQESSSVGLDRLGLEADDMEKIDLFCNMPWGIMLVTGPTGSGKSTTLYSMLQKINQPDVNIITVEDPVEFSVAGINQVHVNEKAGLTFESALRSILRQDPDKVMVGEIRDQKTAQIAIRAALTGHFVLSTLHTNDAPSAATRMIDMGVPPFLVSASLSGVIAQRLVRRLCPICREEYELNENMCETLNVPVGTHAFRPRGCNECRNGYKGRRGIYEIMVVDDDLRRMILEGVSNIQLRAEAIKRGMKTLRQSGINNALAGHTSLEEVFTTTL
ncbi:ATPase, T2SS/T4P/T4SS family [uncultured Fretibacterium sp.]|uniref:ATPase, T2SS/T4P/T4SS family n=1 Tax=uncultured Fretibacterium sp. TaxID=1678694 RepID=UPI00344B237F